MSSVENKKGHQLIRVLRNNLKMLEYIHKYCKGQILISILASIVGDVVSVAGILITRCIINEISERGESAIPTVIMFAGISALLNLFIVFFNNFISSFVSARNMEKIHTGMRSELYEQAVAVELSCYDDAEYYNKFSMAIEQADRRAIAVLNTYTSFFSSLIGTGSLMALVGTIQPIILLFVLFSVLASFAINIWRARIQHRFTKERIPHERRQRYISRVFYLRNYSQELRLFKDMCNMFESHFRDSTNHVIDTVSQYGKTFVLQGTIGGLVGSITSFLTMIYLAIKVVKNAFPLGDFFTVLTGSQQLTSRIIGFLGAFPQFYEHNLYIENFFEFIEQSPIESKDGAPLDTIEEIRFDNVGFTYKNSQKTLCDICLTVRRGERIAIVGDNGAGKSTIVKLMARLYSTDSGCIYVNGKNVDTFALCDYRDNIGVVFQDYAVYAIPIIENVLLRTVQEKSADEAVVWDALRFVGLYEKVASAPNGIYSTVTREFGEDGIYLSGGEMQKLALARLYVKKCSLLIFDEPSSFLDPLSEKQMIESMKMFAEDRCTVMISHRLSNIVDVDRIYVIRQGRVVEVGTHSELMDNRGLYYSMYSGQNNIEKETCGL